MALINAFGAIALDATLKDGTQVTGLSAATLAALESITVQNFPATQAVTGTVSVTPNRGSTSALTSVAMTTASASLTALDTARRRAVLFNDAASASMVLVAFAATASAAAYTVALPVGSSYVVEDYTGAVSGICAAGTATIKVTVIT